jgi:hypothetical protein
MAKWRGELGIHHFAAGDPDAASAQLTRSLAIAREMGFARYEAWAQIYLGAVSIERELDKLTDAQDRIETGLEIADDIGNEEVRIAGLFQLGRLKVAQGEMQTARETLEIAERLATATQNLRLREKIRAELAML